MARRGTTSYFGFLNIAKPQGITAHDVVAAVRKILGEKQIGHGGTLDPLATGVLPIAVGKATRLLRFLTGDKVYLAEIKLGLQTTTDDVTGDTMETSDRVPSLEEVQSALSPFRGAIRQAPPLYSAVHVDGRRLYEMARKGEAPDTVPLRDVVVHNLELLKYEPPVLTARIACSAGTYIRSIARDLGSALGCGGCLQALVREQAGPFCLSGAVSLEALAVHAQEGTLESVFVAPELILGIERVDIDQQLLDRLLHGQSISVEKAKSKPGVDPYVLAMFGNRLAAVCKAIELDGANGFRLQPEVVVRDHSQT